MSSVCAACVKVVRRFAGLVGAAAQQLHDADRVEHFGLLHLLRQRRQRVEGLVVALQFDLRERGEITRLIRVSAARRDGGRDLECGRVIAEIAEHLPERQTHAIVARRELERLLEKRPLTRRGFGDKALDVRLQRLWRREDRSGRRRRHRRGCLAQAPGDALVNREQMAERASLGHFRQQSSGIEVNHPRANGQMIAGQLVGADHDVRRADKLRYLDDGCVTERRRRRKLQALECRYPRLARDARRTKYFEIIGKKDRRSFGEPIQARLGLRIVKRHEQRVAKRRRGCLLRRGRSCAGDDGERRERKNGTPDSHAASAVVRVPSVTAMVQPDPPCARHSVIWTRASRAKCCRNRSTAAQ